MTKDPKRTVRYQVGNRKDAYKLFYLFDDNGIMCSYPSFAAPWTVRVRICDVARADDVYVQLDAN